MWCLIDNNIKRIDMAKRLSALAAGILPNFLEKGFVVIESPKVRKFFYQLLSKNSISYKTSITGYTKGSKSLSRWCGKRIIHWNLNFIAKSIKNRRILKDDVKDACEVKHLERYDFDKISSAFDDGKTVSEIYNILNKEWGVGLMWDKWTPFDNVSLKKTIVRIEKI
jgi:hypothetical protein